jgi:hypothetical protein
MAVLSLCHLPTDRTPSGIVELIMIFVLLKRTLLLEICEFL